MRRSLLLLLLAAGCSKKCPDGYVENREPHFCVGAPQGYSLEKQEKEKDSDEKWTGAIALRPPDKNDARSDVWLEWYDGAKVEEHVADNFGSTWKPFKSNVQQIEIVKLTELPGGGRYGLRKITTQHPEAAKPDQTVKFEAKAVLAAGSRVLECSATVSAFGLKSNTFQPDPAFMETCSKIVQ